MSLHNKKLLNMDTKNCSVLPDLYGADFERFKESNEAGRHIPTQEILTIKTYYEELFSARGHIITYTQFTP